MAGSSQSEQADQLQCKSERKLNKNRPISAITTYGHTTPTLLAFFKESKTCQPTGKRQLVNILVNYVTALLLYWLQHPLHHGFQFELSKGLGSFQALSELPSFCLQKPPLSKEATSALTTVMISYQTGNHSWQITPRCCRTWQKKLHEAHAAFCPFRTSSRGRSLP